MSTHCVINWETLFSTNQMVPRNFSEFPFYLVVWTKLIIIINLGWAVNQWRLLGNFLEQYVDRYTGYKSFKELWIAVVVTSVVYGEKWTCSIFLGELLLVRDRIAVEFFKIHPSSTCIGMSQADYCESDYWAGEWIKDGSVPLPLHWSSVDVLHCRRSIINAIH